MLQFFRTECKDKGILFISWNHWQVDLIIYNSDHRPVYALIDVDILGNYIVGLTQLISMRATYMSIKNFKLKFFTDNFTEAYPDTKLPFEFHIKIFSSAIEDYCESKKLKLLTLEKDLIIEELKPLKFSVNDIRYIKAQKLIIAIYKLDVGNNNSCIGQAVVLLDNAKMKSKCLACGSLQINTRFLGGLTFEYELTA